MRTIRSSVPSGELYLRSWVHYCLQVQLPGSSAEGKESQQRAETSSGTSGFGQDKPKGLSDFWTRNKQGP